NHGKHLPVQALVANRDFGEATSRFVLLLQRAKDTFGCAPEMWHVRDHQALAKRTVLQDLESRPHSGCSEACTSDDGIVLGGKADERIGSTHRLKHQAIRYVCVNV